MPGILPPLELDESLETTKIHSVAGKLGVKRALVEQRPFRSPHHSISELILLRRVVKYLQLPQQGCKSNAFSDLAYLTIILPKSRFFMSSVFFKVSIAPLLLRNRSCFFG